MKCADDAFSVSVPVLVMIMLFKHVSVELFEKARIFVFNL